MLHSSDISSKLNLALLWQKSNFGDSQGGISLIHGEPALVEAGDGKRLAQ
jgi:hypothetical protein